MSGDLFAFSALKFDQAIGPKTARELLSVFDAGRVFVLDVGVLFNV
jgi:hypothetical protein